MSTDELRTLAQKEAHHLRHIAADLRSAGDVPQVMFDADGVAPALPLSVELELIAFNPDAAAEPQP